MAQEPTKLTEKHKETIRAALVTHMRSLTQTRTRNQTNKLLTNVYDEMIKDAQDAERAL